MYCASPSGLRRWSWDNDTASARLEAIGDVPWGKVGAGALHYNADGQQVRQYMNLLHICDIQQVGTRYLWEPLYRRVRSLPDTPRGMVAPD